MRLFQPSCVMNGCTVTIIARGSHGLSFFFPSNSIYYLTIRPPHFTQLRQCCFRPLRSTLRFYCSYLYTISHPSFHMVDIPNAPFYSLLYVPYDPRSHIDTLSRRPSLVDVSRHSHVYKETPSLGSWALSLT